MNENKFWEFKAAAEKKGQLFLYGPICDSRWDQEDIAPAAFQKDLAALGQIEQLDVYLNSPGGSVFAGITIYNILKRYNAIKVVHVDGIAASSASIVAMAGDKIIVPKNGTLMIHNAWALAMGNKSAMRDMADELDRLDGQLADIYSARTGKDKAVVSAWMDSEHWMSGEEALADGFCDEVEENKKIAACADTEKYFARYRHPPLNIPYTITPNEPAAADGGFFRPGNGGASQPVADKIPDAITEQRKRFNELRKKMMRG